MICMQLIQMIKGTDGLRQAKQALWLPLGAQSYGGLLPLRSQCLVCVHCRMCMPRSTAFQCRFLTAQHFELGQRCIQPCL